MERVIFLSSLNHSLSKIIIFIDVNMHIIFVTLTHRFRGEKLRGHLMHGYIVNKKERKWTRSLHSFFLLLRSLSRKLHLSHSFFARLSLRHEILTDRQQQQQHFHLLYRSCYLQNAYIQLLFLLRLNDFEYHRRRLTTLIRKEDKQAR